MTEALGTSRKTGVLLLVLAGGLFLAAFRGVIGGLVNTWASDANYSHGFLVPLIAGYFLWEKRKVLAEVRPHPSDWGLAVAVLGVLLLMASQLAQAVTYRNISMLATAAGIVIFLLGWPFFRAVAFPFAYLLFMIPVPRELYDAVAVPLKFFVSRYSVAVLQVLGVTVMHEGNIIILPATTLEVADACSGIRSLISLLALAVAWAYYTQKGFLRKAVMVASAVPIAVVVNGLRVVVTGVLAQHYGARAAEGFFHEFAGLLIFVGAVALLFLVGFVMNLVPPRGRRARTSPGEGGS